MPVHNAIPVESHEPSGAYVEVTESRSLADVFDATLAALDPDQRRRWEHLRRAQDRNDFLAARALAARLVGRALAVAGEVGFVQVCVTCGGPHGRPRAVAAAGVPLPLDVSWAHSDGIVAAAAIADPASRVGVDVEHLDPLAIVPGLPCSGRSFVRGEAAVKAGALTLDAAVAGEFDWPLGDSGRIDAATVWDVPSGYPEMIAAVAVRRVTQ